MAIAKLEKNVIKGEERMKAKAGKAFNYRIKKFILYKEIQLLSLLNN